MSNDVKTAPCVPLGATLAGSSVTTGEPGGDCTLDAKRDQLCLLINSRNPIIAVETTEEQRFSLLLQRVAVAKPHNR